MLFCLVAQHIVALLLLLLLPLLLLWLLSGSFR
jgi:hypothetical protein